MGRVVVEVTGEMVMLLITLLCVVRVAVVVMWRGERKTVPVDKVSSLLSVTEGTGLTTIFGVILLPR